MSAAESSLEDVVELLERERKRVPMEAPWELTKAYAQLLIANGFARVGQSERGRELVGAADTILAPLSERKRVPGYRTRVESLGVHGYLREVLHQRFADACAYRPRTTRLPQALVEAHDALDRVAQYKVDRLAEASQTVSVTGRTGSVDPIGSWIQGRRIVQVDVAAEVAPERVPEPAARADRIAAELEKPHTDAQAVTLLQEFVELPSDAALPSLAATVTMSRGGPRVQALACFVAMRFGFGELATPIIDRLQPLLAATSSADEVVEIVAPLLRVKQWLRSESDLIPIFERVWSAFPDDALPQPTRLIVAAGLSNVSGDSRLDDLVDAYLSSSMTLPVRFLRLTPFAAAATYASRTFGRELVRRLSSLWDTMTDSYGSNSHFCLSVLQLVETLVLAHVDLTLANANVIDPEQQALLTSGFAL